MQLFIDESGNTQETIVLALVAVQESSLDAVNQLFSLRPYDPPELIALYNRKDKNGKPRGEFKYSDFKNAFAATDLPIYRTFLADKFEKLSEIKFSAYVSAFPNPGNEHNDERLRRLEAETNWLLEKWGHQNIGDALSPELRIFCDQQIYRRDLDFLAVLFRGKKYMFVGPSGKEFHSPYYPSSVFKSPTKNRTNIISRSSKSCLPLQLADLVAGSFRDKITNGVFNFFDRLSSVIPSNHVRQKLNDYDYPPIGQC